MNLRSGQTFENLLATPRVVPPAHLLIKVNIPHVIDGAPRPSHHQGPYSKKGQQFEIW